VEVNDVFLIAASNITPPSCDAIVLAMIKPQKHQLSQIHCGGLVS